MSEKRLQKEMTTALKQVVWSNIESGMTSPGFPDMHYTLPGGKEGTIELKYCGEHSKKKLIRPMQVSWWRSKSKNNGKVRLLALVNVDSLDYYCLYTSIAQIKQLARTNSPLDWLSITNDWWNNNMDWDELYHEWL